MAPNHRIRIGPGNDNPPQHPSSAHESEKAAPEWAKHQGFAPQLPQADQKKLFQSVAKPKKGTTEGSHQPSFVVCQATFGGAADTGLKGLFGSSKPDLNVHVMPAGLPKISAYGADNHANVFVSVPLATFNPADKWSFEILDRDHHGSDNLGTVEVSMGSPSSATKGKTSIVCRQIPQSDVEPLLLAALPLADSSIEKTAHGTWIDPRDGSLGLSPVRSTLHRALESLAALVGWADPRVQRRRDWAARILTAFREKRKTFVLARAKEHGQKAAFAARWSHFEVEKVELACGTEVGEPYLPKHQRHQRKSQKGLSRDGDIGCILRLLVRNDGQKDARIKVFFGSSWKPVVARADGETWRPKLLEVEGPEVQKRGKDRILAPRTRGTFVFGMPAEANSDDTAKRAALLVLNPSKQSGPVFLSLLR